MKKLFLITVGIILISFSSLNAQKVGFCEIDKIVPTMPEYEKAKAKLEGEMNEIQLQAEEMQVEFNNKYKIYTENAALPIGDTKKWSTSIQQVKDQELSQLQQRIQDFQYTAQENIQIRQLELLEPITTKIDSVINVIMDEKGFFYIIKDITVIQVNRTKCEDISPLVKQKLGLQ